MNKIEKKIVCDFQNLGDCDFGISLLTIQLTEPFFIKDLFYPIMVISLIYGC